MPTKRPLCPACQIHTLDPHNTIESIFCNALICERCYALEFQQKFWWRERAIAVGIPVAEGDLIDEQYA